MKNLKKIKIIHVCMLVLTIAVIFLGYQICLLNEKEYQESVQSTIYHLENAQSIKRLEFCAKHAIKDCTEDNVDAWSRNHPEDAFKVKSHLDISRQAVELTKQAGY